MKTVLVVLFFCLPGFALNAEKPADPIPVKVFVVAHDQQDHGTASYAEAVRKQFAESPDYKLWTGAPKDFPKNGIFIDIQGIDVRDGDDKVIGSTVIAAATMQSKTEPGYSRVLVQNLLEILPNGDDVADEAKEFLEDVNHHVSHASSKEAPVPPKKIVPRKTKATK